MEALGGRVYINAVEHARVEHERIRVRAMFIPLQRRTQPSVTEKPRKAAYFASWHNHEKSFKFFKVIVNDTVRCPNKIITNANHTSPPLEKNAAVQDRIKTIYIPWFRTIPSEFNNHGVGERN